MTSGYCDCRARSNCCPYKHKGATENFKNSPEFNILPESDSKTRVLYHYISYGSLCTNEWYRDIDNRNENTNVAEVRTNIASSSNNLFENVEDKSIEILPLKPLNFLKFIQY